MSSLSVLKLFSKESDEYFKSVLELINKNNELTSEIEKLRINYNLQDDNSFNFFTSISPIYYRENFHSDILKNILNRNTQEIGNFKYLDIFLDLIDDKNAFDKKDEVYVVREQGRIDLLLHNHKNAVIIENKINNACDQDNQLARYIEYANQQGLTVSSIVYLTLVEGKKPNLNYDEKYIKYIPEIEKKIKYVAAVTNNKKDIAHHYLDSCIEVSNNPTAIVYLNQYKKLLLSLGVDEIMKEFSKKILETIFSNKEDIKKTQDLVETWNKKDELLKEIVFDHIKLIKTDYLNHSYGNTIAKKINEKYSFAYHISGSFGFITSSADKYFSEEDTKILSSFLEDEFISNYTTEVLHDDQKWIYRDIQWNIIDGDLKDRIDLVENILDTLENKYTKSLLNK